MDPNLFHLDWGRTIEALVGVIVLAFLVERVCALVFESRWWIRLFDDARVGEALPSEKASEKKKSPKKGSEEEGTAESEKPNLLPGRKYPLKEVIGFLVALAICWTWDFDAVSMILLSERTQLVGIIITAAVVAGGSKASIALFHDLLDVKSSALKERQNYGNSGKKNGGSK